jgi:hypothetical protein
MKLGCIVCGTVFQAVDPQLALGIPPDAPKLGLCDTWIVADVSELAGGCVGPVRADHPAEGRRLRRLTFAVIFARPCFGRGAISD